jgi:hypothetical protein
MSIKHALGAFNLRPEDLANLMGLAPHHITQAMRENACKADVFSAATDLHHALQWQVQQLGQPSYFLLAACQRDLDEHIAPWLVAHDESGLETGQPFEAADYRPYNTAVKQAWVGQATHLHQLVMLDTVRYAAMQRIWGSDLSDYCERVIGQQAHNLALARLHEDDAEMVVNYFSASGGGRIRVPLEDLPPEDKAECVELLMETLAQLEDSKR